MGVCGGMDGSAINKADGARAFFTNWQRTWNQVGRLLQRRLPRGVLEQTDVAVGVGPSAWFSSGSCGGGRGRRPMLAAVGLGYDIGYRSGGCRGRIRHRGGFQMGARRSPACN